MRLKEREITDKAEIESILKKSRVCRISLMDEDKPYIVPMNFGYKNGTLYLHSAKEGRKIELIKKNPNICFEVDELVRLKKAEQACDWGAQYQSVIGNGRAVFLEEGEKKAGLDIIMAHYSQRQFEYPEEMLGKTAVIKIAIDNMTGKQI
ncbi:MAG: pyridoxamine 5'-phosphate oxidase family protein [Desulfobacula sp.]|nr:pyridoxamine 5'-phosphate oxidase family protein [Desulfobacula sp.]